MFKVASNRPIAAQKPAEIPTNGTVQNRQPKANDRKFGDPPLTGRSFCDPALADLRSKQKSVRKLPQFAKGERGKSARDWKVYR